MRSVTRRGRFLILTIVAAFVAGCTGHPSAETSSFRPHFQQAPCPPDVEILQFGPHSCGFLTVLEDRSKHSGRTIKLFVMKVSPPDDQPIGSTISPPANIGDPHGWSDSLAGATRTHSVLYGIDIRGVGHSTPDLACPEVDALAPDAAAAPTADPGFGDEFVSAVKACHDRLTSLGIDLSSYDVQETSADLVDLAHALGLRSWATGALGSSSVFTLEAARLAPDEITRVFMDSPAFLQAPDPSASVVGFDYALGQLAHACATDRACRRIAPHLTSLMARAVRVLNAHPVHIVTRRGALAAQNGGSVPILVDGGKLLRAVRSALGGEGPENIADLPATIATAASGRVSPQLASILSNDPTLCAGYRPECAQPAGGFSWGLYLSVFCRDEAPFADGTGLEEIVRGGATYRALFEDDPYLAACGVWNVEPASPSVHEPINVNVPMLMMTGQFDSFSPKSIAEAAGTTLSRAYVLEIPGQTHNTLGYDECPIQIRNAWVLHPDSPPADTSCLNAMQTTFSAVP